MIGKICGIGGFGGVWWWLIEMDGNDSKVMKEGRSEGVE